MFLGLLRSAQFFALKVQASAGPQRQHFVVAFGRGHYQLYLVKELSRWRGLNVVYEALAKRGMGASLSEPGQTLGRGCVTWSG